MRRRDRRFFLSCLLACSMAWLPGRADSGDIEGAHDYPGWARMPGFEITDYDEDNPAEFTFPVSRPQAMDANHLEDAPVSGHRYVIRYEWSGSAQAPSLLQTQRHYEKLAAASGYTLEKSGAVGNVTETFVLAKEGHQTWVFLKPSGRVNVLTIMESRGAVSTPVAATKSASAPPPAPAPAAAPMPTPTTPAVAANPPPAPSPVPTPSKVEDPIATALLQNGRVALPLSFLPGKPDLNADSQPVIDRVVAILKQHPEMSLTIEGHTDRSGDEQANIVLSRDRAQTVRGLLIAGSIKRTRLIATGLGGAQPLVDESTAEGREKNRRIELVVRKAGATVKTPVKDVTKKAVAPPGDATATDDGKFHATAPDGVNYYPAH